MKGVHLRFKAGGTLKCLQKWMFLPHPEKLHSLTNAVQRFEIVQYMMRAEEKTTSF